jgi:glycosyltransferase involved in cell wall biosynthesis
MQFDQMQTKHLHIVSFNVPYPADYGGVIDVFYRIKALSEADVKIHLHCFQYGREEATMLNNLCEEVTYYKRSLSVVHQLSMKPFIVKSRSSRELLRNLLKKEYPILFEGLHSCFFLDHPKLKERNKIVRCHNIEHHYYQSLAQGLKSVTLTSYFKLEAFKLKRFEQILHQANHIAAISEADENYFQQHYGRTFLMRPSHPASVVDIQPGKGDYLLYHGDLSTPENIESALFIVREIAPFVQQRFILAGKNPSAKLINEANRLKNIELKPNPSHHEMQELIRNAQVNLLPTFQATGFKLKLINALFAGRFCLVSPEMLAGTGLQACCEIASDPNDFIGKIEFLFSKPFLADELQKRTALLEKFSNNAAISKLLELI